MDDTPGSMVQRMMGAALLNVNTFEEVEHDESATGQAAAVVAMVAIAQAIGQSGEGLVGAAAAAVAALIGWGIWAGITYGVGDKMLGGTATWGEILRTTGFAQAPGLLAIVGVLPLLGIINWFLWIWIAIAAFIALRQALDLGNGKTLLTIVIGLGVYVLFAAVVAVLV